jgi:hypothetical protein
MNIELKKVKTFIGNEGQGLNAEVWVDGVRTCYVVDDASGSVFYDFTVYNNEKWNELLAHVASIPEKPMIIDGKPWERENGEIPLFPATVEEMVDEAFKKYEQARTWKVLEKKFVKALVWGKKDWQSQRELKYTEVKWKVPLAELSTPGLQYWVNKYKAEMKDDECFYNTNFKSLKIKI